MLAQNAGETLKEIINKVEIVTEMVRHISTATAEQSSVTDHIAGDIQSVVMVINETNKGAEQIAQASSEISELASGLKSMVEVFKVSEKDKVRA